MKNKIFSLVFAISILFSSFSNSMDQGELLYLLSSDIFKHLYVVKPDEAARNLMDLYRNIDKWSKLVFIDVVKATKKNGKYHINWRDDNTFGNFKNMWKKDQFKLNEIKFPNLIMDFSYIVDHFKKVDRSKCYNDNKLINKFLDCLLNWNWDEAKIKTYFEEKYSKLRSKL